MGMLSQLGWGRWPHSWHLLTGGRDTTTHPAGHRTVSPHSRDLHSLYVESAEVEKLLWILMLLIFAGIFSPKCL